MILFHLHSWSPNYLSTMPYHLQLKEVIQRAMRDGRCPRHTVLPAPETLGTRSRFQKAYAIKAYALLMDEGCLSYAPDSGCYVAAG